MDNGLEIELFLDEILNESSLSRLLSRWGDKMPGLRPAVVLTGTGGILAEN